MSADGEPDEEQQITAHYSPCAVFFIDTTYLNKAGNELRKVPLEKCLSSTPISHDHVVIVVCETRTNPSQYNVWGLHRIAPLLCDALLTHVISSICQADCRPRGMELQGDAPGSLIHESLEDEVEGGPVNLDMIESEAALRLMQYVAPTRAGLSSLTTRSCVMASAAVRYQSPVDLENSFKAFRRSELIIARKRLERSSLFPVAPGSYFEVDVCSLPGTTLLRLLKHSHGTITFVGGGIIRCYSMAFWLWPVVFAISQRLRQLVEVPRPEMGRNDDLIRMLIKFRRTMMKQDRKRRMEKLRHLRKLEEAEYVPVPDLEDLTYIMPGCMAHLMKKAQRPTASDHLRHAQRITLINFMQMNGANMDAYREMVVSRSHGDARYTKKLAVEIHNNIKSFQKSKTDYTSCKTAPCPYTSRCDSGWSEERKNKETRNMCHNNMLRLTGKTKEEDSGLWFQSPAHFTQRVAQQLRDRDVEKPVTVSTVSAAGHSAAASPASSPSSSSRPSSSTSRVTVQIEQDRDSDDDIPLGVVQPMGFSSRQSHLMHAGSKRTRE